MDKFLVYLDEGADARPIAVRHNSKPKVNLFVIGGFGKDRTVMEQLMVRFFKLDPFDTAKVKEKWHQRNKMRFTTKMERKRFVYGLESMRKGGLVVVEVKDHYGLLS
jgi:hypothetical protein